jgi:leucine dehydrogenase
MHSGGAKAVLALDHPVEGAEREGLLMRYGDLVESLAGAFGTGADLGTGAEGMAIVARRTQYVIGVDADGGSTDPGPFTARGVYEGMRSALLHLYGEASPRGRTVLVEGLGGVGLPLVESLRADGARLLLADLDEEKARTLARKLEADVVSLADVPSTECDVYAPCAVGATVNPDTVPLLRCKVVAGAANNQLLSDDDAVALHERGIVYAPDYIVNAGGAMGLTLLREGVSRDDTFARVATIGATVAEILAEAAAANQSPIAAAKRRAQRVLDEA